MIPTKECHYSRYHRLCGGKGAADYVPCAVLQKVKRSLYNSVHIDLYAGNPVIYLLIVFKHIFRPNLNLGEEGLRRPRKLPHGIPDISRDYNRT